MKKVIVLFLFLLLLLQQEAYAAKETKSKIEMLPWKDVSQLLPRYSKFTVVDFETGKEFEVQRRAGSQHADVQPLTPKDTKVMKKIYGGKWSWRRRAIIVIHNNQRIAASMHGMPHGAGALKNNFPGHFCIHFYGSTTHRTNAMDLSHMLMVYKASGKLDDYLQNASPNEVVSAFVAGIKQRDKRISTLTSLQKIKWKPIFTKVENAKIAEMSNLPVEELRGDIKLVIPIKVDWYLKDKGRQVVKGEIHLYRLSPLDAWKVDSKQFLKENHLM
jgi:hypothetical protein